MFKIFIDEAKIFIEGGRGGNGCASFHREKYRPKGGPDGGDGGKGGNVVLSVDSKLHTLIDFHYRRYFKPEDGGHGQGNNKRGKDGKDLVLRVPPGTVVKDEQGNVLFDLAEEDEQIVAAKGGLGGRGNASLANLLKKVPGFAEKGEPGEKRELLFDLKCLADVGLIGYPNVGKSTLISRISKAKPKIADYPFTTTVPHLGVVKMDDESFIVADVPGLIEGAHRGRGLGHVFLKHVERASLLVHVLDLASVEERDPIDDFEKVNNELKKYSPKLARRPQIVVGNKMDLPTASDNLSRVSVYFKDRKYQFFPVSAVTGEGINAFLYAVLGDLKIIWQKKLKRRKKRIIIKPREGIKDFKVIKKEDGSFLVQGAYVERLVSMTDMNNEEAILYLQKRLRKIGVEEELVKAGAKEKDLVKIGPIEFDFYLS